MAKEMIVLQGKSFSIDLQSMLGSTCWGWCLTRLPQGIALIGMETIPTAAGVAPVIQRFWFGALSAVKDKAEIGFTLINLSDMTSAKQKVDVNVTVIPKDSEDFAKFSENCDDAVDPVGPTWEECKVYSSAKARIAHGGSYNFWPRGCRSAARRYQAGAQHNFGFRVAIQE